MVQDYNTFRPNNSSKVFPSIPGCEPCKGFLLDEITITAPRLPQLPYSSIYDNWVGSINPIFRNIGLQYSRGNYSYLSHAFNQRTISYGERLGYETEFMLGLNTIGERVTTGLIYTSLGALASPAIAYGLPLLAQSGAFSLSGGFGTSAILTRVGIETGSQLAVNIGYYGFYTGIENMDVADIIIAGSGLNFVSGAILEASIDIKPFARSRKFSALGLEKNKVDVITDVSISLISGGQSRLLDKTNINKPLVNFFNLWNSTKINTFGTIVKENINNIEDK